MFSAHHNTSEILTENLAEVYVETVEGTNYINKGTVDRVRDNCFTLDLTIMMDKGEDEEDGGT
jgi:hypothetical protein